MSNLPKNHPVRYLIESAATGRKLTAGDLDLLGNADLPTGESLKAFSASVDSAARRVASIGATGANGDALRQAQEEWSTLANRMTSDQLNVSSSTKAGDTSVQDMVSNMFNNN